MGLVETKHRKTIKRKVNRLWGSDDYECCESFTTETCGGGMISIWDPGKFNVYHKHIAERWILLEGCIVSEDFECCVGVIYGPNNRVKRNVMFVVLTLFNPSINLYFCWEILMKSYLVVKELENLEVI